MNCEAKYKDNGQAQFKVGLKNLPGQLIEKQMEASWLLASSWLQDKP